MVMNAFKFALCFAVETDYSFPEAEKVCAYLADPSAFQTDAPAAATEEKKEAAPVAAKEESESESEEEELSLFD